MPSLALIKYYASLVRKKIMDIEDIDIDIREDVQRAMNGEYTAPTMLSALKTTEEVFEQVEDSCIGAITLDDIYIHVNDEDIVEDDQLINIDLPLDVDAIFSDDILNGNPFPENLDIHISYLENIYNLFSHDVKAEMIKDGILSKIHISATSIDKKDVDEKTFLRIDLVIGSSNYENMFATVYLTR